MQPLCSSRFLTLSAAAGLISRIFFSKPNRKNRHAMWLYSQIKSWNGINNKSPKKFFIHYINPYRLNLKLKSEFTWLRSIFHFYSQSGFNPYFKTTKFFKFDYKVHRLIHKILQKTCGLFYDDCCIKYVRAFIFPFWYNLLWLYWS